MVWPDAATDANRSQLFAIDLEGGDARALTHGHRDTGPTFSPDGSRLGFIRTEPDGPSQVMVLSWPVGEILEAARFDDDVQRLGWSAASDGSGPRLLVLATTRPVGQHGVDDRELERRPRILTTIDYRFNGRGYINDRPRQLFVLPYPTGDATARPGGRPQGRPDNPVAGGERSDRREIGAAGVDHGWFAVSPDGSQVAATATTEDDADLTGCNHVWLYPLDISPAGSGEPRCLTPVGGRWETLRWHPDGTLVATGRMDGRTVGFSRPHRVGVAGTAPTVEPIGHHDHNVAPGSLSGNGVVAIGSPEDGSGSSMLYPGFRRGRIAIDEYRLADGGHAVIHEGPHQVVAFDATPDGRTIVAAVSTPERPAELWLLRHQREQNGPKRLVTLNDDVLAELDIAGTEVVSVTSADGTAVEAFVVRPPTSAPATTATRPGLVYVHGGPMFQYGLGFFDEFQIAAACGYVVIGGNPRGSDGYGEAWARSIVGGLGDKDWADVSAIADHLQAMPEVAADRIGIGGGSYGGFMAAWALAHDQRFGAGLVERAVTSWNTMFGTSDIGNWFTAMMLDATVESAPDRVTDQSPLHHAAAITAPTLIVHSEQDWRCPIEQAEQLFAAIRRNGGRATLVRFPGENHELSRSGKPSHRVERFEIVHEFFARHLGGADFGTSHLPDEATADH